MVSEDQNTNDLLERMLRHCDELHEKLLALLDDAEFDGFLRMPEA